MKHLLIIALAVISSLCVSAQGLNLGVVVPEETVDGVDAKAYKVLGTKLERMITTCGATSVNGGNHVIFPVINFVSDDMIEGGMRNIYSVEFELTAKAVSLSTNTTFGSVTWTLKGKGYTKSEAVREGVNKLMANDARFSSFFRGVKSKIEAYYVNNKTSLIAQAKTLATQKRYEEAASLLYEYPTGVAGYKDVQTALNNIYKQYKTANCSQTLQEARAKFAMQDYETAAALIADIDATSSCAGEAKTLSNQIRQKINSDQAAERAQALEEKRIASSVEKARIKAISNMVSAYYKRRPRVTYNTIVVRRW